MDNPPTIPPSTDIGSLGIAHLKRMWSAAIATQQGSTINRAEEVDLDQQVLNALGLGLHQAFQYLFRESPTFAEFEDWVVATAGRPDPLSVDRLNAVIGGRPYSEPVRQWLRAIEDHEPVLTQDDLACWEENGYCVLKDAVAQEGVRDAGQAIWDYVGGTPEAPDSWYRGGTDHGIMVELIQHPALARNRRAARIHKAFAQLWGTADLWVTADRCGFHPPQREDHPFPGPDLHWDLNFTQPLRFGTQGILYLADTPPEQGALTVVPGFHKRLADWLAELEPGADPQQQDLHALGSAPIGGQAGDMIIWHHWLPHGSRPNLGRYPRIVQYINMLPSTSAVAPLQ